jgi:hypothetical protein
MITVAVTAVLALVAFLSIQPFHVRAPSRLEVRRARFPQFRNRLIEILKVLAVGGLKLFFSQRLLEQKSG